MERKTTLLIGFFIAVAVISVAGFFNSYLRFLPDTVRFSAVVHVHFAAFISWFLLIIVQPVLIRVKKYELHRRVGKLSYFIAPVLVTTILILVNNQTSRMVHISEKQAAVSAFIGILDAISFSGYYVVAMVHKRNVRWHIAFLIAATLVVLNPGMSRLLNSIKPGLGLPAAVLLPFILTISILTIEKLKYKRPLLKSPYFIFFCCWTVEIGLLMTIPSTELWKDFVLNYYAE